MKTLALMLAMTVLAGCCHPEIKFYQRTETTGRTDFGVESAVIFGGK